MKTKRNAESGYALLLIFAMAAVVAITLYSQVPRVAFEAQRDKEQLLIDRGEQYSRAVKLFVRKFNRFPATMEELENTNNQRFLRRRYNDPMTGKQDWRILHAGPGGVIVDSVDSKKPSDTALQNPNSILTLGGMSTLGGGDSGTPSGVNLATRQRPSDQTGGAGDPNNNSGGPPASSPTTGPVTVLPDGRIVPLSSVVAGPNGTFQLAPQSGPGATGATGIPNTPNNLPINTAIQQNAQNNSPNAPNTPALPGQIGGPPGSAASLINQILTTPRPGGMGGIVGQPGVQSTGQPVPISSTASAPQQQVIGAGLAGVASKREQEGIKLYNQHTAYNEWEFVYDISKDPSMARAGGRGGTGGQGPGGRGGSSTPGGPAMPAGFPPGIGRGRGQ